MLHAWLGWLLATSGGEPVKSLQVNMLAWAADSRSVWVGVEDDTVRQIDVDGGRTLRVLRVGEGDPLAAIAVAPRGELVAAITEGGRIHVWSAATGAERFELGKRGWVADGPIVFSPDGRLIVGMLYREDDAMERATLFAWSTASGWARGRRRLREAPRRMWGVVPSYFRPIALAGHGLHFDEAGGELLVGAGRLRLCGMTAPRAMAPQGDVGWYVEIEAALGTGGLRRTADCELLRAGSRALPEEGRLSLATGGARAAILTREPHSTGELTVVDVFGDRAVGSLKLPEGQWIGGGTTAIAPDGAAVAAALNDESVDGAPWRGVMIWRPDRAPGEPGALRRFRTGPSRQGLPAMSPGAGE